MLNWLRTHWRKLAVVAIFVYVIALWTWVLAGLSEQSEICEITAAGKDCERYNILFAVAWKVAKAVDHWSALVTAFATAAIAYFTWTIKRINDAQLRHAHQVERAYISGGGGPEVLQNGMATETFILCINNYGKTQGELLRYGVGFCESDAIPETPEYAWVDYRDWYGPGTIGREIARYGIPKLQRPVVYGRFLYQDIFGGKHSIGFINRLLFNTSKPILAPRAYTEERDES